MCKLGLHTHTLNSQIAYKSRLWMNENVTMSLCRNDCKIQRKDAPEQLHSYSVAKEMPEDVHVRWSRNVVDFLFDGGDCGAKTKFL